MDESFKPYVKFEKICFEILRKHAYEIETYRTYKSQGKFYEIDAIVKNSENREAVVEVKLYRSLSINLNYIEKALENIKRKSLETEIPNTILMVSVKLDAYYKESLEKKYGVYIIDVENIMFLSNSVPEARKELIELLGIRSDNESGIKETFFDFNKVFSSEQQKREEIDTTKLTGYSEGERLYSALVNIKKGQQTFAAYEDKCTEILKYLFEDCLDGWHKQNRTDDGLHRFDLICRIKKSDGIWSIFINDFKSRYLLFEFKNYSEPISQNQIYTTEKYLFAKALRNIAIIISRHGADNNALKAADGIIKESGKVILNVDDSIIREMLKMKDSGSDPTDSLFDLLDQRLLQLSK